jgi:hypothetical protein
VMSLWFVAFQGSTPIGGPIVGYVMAQAGARAGLGLGAITCIFAALMGLWVLRRLSPGTSPPAIARVPPGPTPTPPEPSRAAR